MPIREGLAEIPRSGYVTVLGRETTGLKAQKGKK
jgi:hypothetical protein